MPPGIGSSKRRSALPLPPPPLTPRCFFPYFFPPKHENSFRQITCPAGIQILSTPLNLLGLNLYNNPTNSATARAKFIVSQYKSSMTLRVSRTLPAFGVGGVSNIEIRNFFNALLDS